MTIRDVARRAGVSTAAVSLAVNGKPGVARSTRRRIEAAAAALDWRPSPPARTLRGEATHGGAVALAAGPPGGERQPGTDEFIAGALAELNLAGRHALLLPGGLPAVRQAWQAGQIHGAILLGQGTHVAPAEPRAAFGVPRVGAVWWADRGAADAGPSSVAVPAWAGAVWWDDRAAADATLAYLAALGHRRIGYVAGHGVHGRLEALRHSAAAHRIESAVAVAAGGDRVAGAARATRSLLADPRPPTALVYDTATGAATGLGVAREMAVAVPRTLSVLAWQDSVLCTLTHPRITAMAQGAAGLGGHAVRVLLALLDHRAPPPAGEAAHRPVHRESVAPAPGSAPATRAARRPAR